MQYEESGIVPPYQHTYWTTDQSGEEVYVIEDPAPKKPSKRHLGDRYVALLALIIALVLLVLVV